MIMPASDSPNNEIRPVATPAEAASAIASRRALLQRRQLLFPAEETGVVFEDEHIIIHRDPVGFPGGKFGTYIRIHERAIQNGVAGVVILPKCGEDVFLHRIYRYPTRSWEWEFPRGFLEPGHSPEDMVRQELQEETGLTVATIEELGLVLSNSGLLSGGVKAYVVQTQATAGKPAPEAGEVIGELRRVSPARLWSMAKAGEIRDGITLSTMSLALAKQLLAPPA